MPASAILITMPAPTSIDARPEPALPRFLALDRLSLSRRALIVLGVGAGPVAIWAYEISHAHNDRPALAIMLLPAVASLILAPVNHAGAQLATRGIWWFNLLFGTVAAVSSQGWQPALVACGAGLALLSAWDAGLRSGERTREPFEPVAFRRSLLVSITMAVAEVQLLAMGSTMLFLGNEPEAGAGAAASAAVLALGTYGLFRLRFWGVLLHLTAMLGVATLVALAMKHAHALEVICVWVGTVSVQMLLPMPMLLTILRRRPVRVGSPSAAPGRLFAALVATMMGAAALSAVLRALR
jgi:hypothetical protein